MWRAEVYGVFVTLCLVLRDEIPLSLYLEFTSLVAVMCQVALVVV